MRPRGLRPVKKPSIPLWTAVFLVLNVAGVTCSAQVQFPDTPAARQCAAWLQAFNRGERETYRDFLQKKFPSRVERLDQDLDFRERTGGFELRKVEESTQRSWWRWCRSAPPISLDGSLWR